jgi:hypothetical protein
MKCFLLAVFFNIQCLQKNHYKSKIDGVKGIFIAQAPEILEDVLKSKNLKNAEGVETKLH